MRAAPAGARTRRSGLRRAGDHAVASAAVSWSHRRRLSPAATTFPAGAGLRRARAMSAPFSSRPVASLRPTAARQRAAVLGQLFLSRPGQKARRLGALVSDIVVYHPEKRLEGLRHGTLKQIFEEEIKKSWEEYAGQVGRELAESTTHFTDALNEILGDGSKIF
jgi:hypothetical protein